MNLDVSGIPYTIYTTDVSGRLVQIEKDVSGAFVQRDMSGVHIDIPGLCINGDKESAKVLSSNSWPVAKDSVKESMQSILETLLEPPTKLHEIVLATPAAPVAPVLAVEVSKPTKKSRCTIV